MMYLKALSLTFVAALALMAFVGVSSASASGKICSTSGVGTACAGSHGKEYTGTFDASLIETTGGKGEVHGVFTSGFVTVTCSASTVTGTITNSATGTGDIEGMTFTGCVNNINGGACTWSSTASPTNKWHLTADANAATNGNGFLTVENVQISFTCNILGANRTCFYGSAKVGTKEEIDLFGSDTTPTVEATGIPMEKKVGSDGLCSATETWEARYGITTPSSLWIT
jgi:hypothetical protein